MRPSPRPRHPRRHAVGAVLLGVALVVVLAVPASAHVAITPPTAPKGGFGVFSFVVPNESDTASTVQVQVVFPADHPIASVSVQPIPGWAWAAQTARLAKPTKTDDGEVSEVVSTVTWSGGTIGPGEFQMFTVSMGPLPTSGKQVEFKVLQTYSDGQVTRWIEQTPKGGPEPEYPAPVLELVGRAKSG